MLVLALACAAALAVGLISHSPWVAAQLTAWDLKRFEQGVERIMDRGAFLDFEGRLTVDEIPNADYSRGGVYFFGTSAMKWATKMWELTPEQRQLIANYGIGATNHTLQAQFIRYLVQQRDLAVAGDRMRVVLGGYWSMGLEWDPKAFFKPLWERHGLYRYRGEAGIQPLEMNPAVRWVRQEKAWCSEFLGGVINRLARWTTTGVGMRLAETENIRDQGLVREFARRSAEHPAWQDQLARQMSDLEALICYLRERKVQVTVVLLPQRAAFEEFPLPVAYRRELRALCSRLSVPFNDLSRLLSEDEFWDMNHSNYRGLTKTHAILMTIAREHLRSAGLSACPSASRRAGQ